MGPWLLPLLCLVAVAACDGPKAPPPEPRPTPPQTGATSSQNSTTIVTTSRQAVVPAEARADLRALAAELPKRHKNLFFRLTEAQWNAAVTKLETALPKLTKPQLATRFAALVASVGDGHTELTLETLPGFRRYPLMLHAFSDGLYIANVAKRHAAFRGKRIVRIGKLDSAAAQVTVASLISHDNASTLAGRVPTHLVIPEVLQALGVIDSAATARFETADGGVLELHPVDSWRNVTWTKPSEPLPHYRQKPSLRYWNDYLAKPKALYFKYNVCADQKPPAMSFAKLVEGTLGFMKQKPVERFILDLRDNGGGNSRIAAPLIEALAAHPTLNRPGGIYVIIGRHTFSSAVLNTIELQQKTKALLVGEPTGGKPNHYGEVKRFTLPHSGWTVSYSTKYFTSAKVVGDPDAIHPDIPVKVTGKDYFAGRDPVLEAALSHQP